MEEATDRKGMAGASIRKRVLDSNQSTKSASGLRSRRSLRRNYLVRALKRKLPRNRKIKIAVSGSISP